MSTVCDLSQRHCIPCEGGVPTIERAEAESMLADLEGWNLSDDGKLISRKYEFRGFLRTMSFINATNRTIVPMKR